MNTANCARASQIMRNVSNGKYVNNNKFHNHGSIIEDSILAQQRWADERLAQLQRKRDKIKK